MRKLQRMLWLIAALVLFAPAENPAVAAGKETIYNSPYVSFAPDGKAWTTNAGDRNAKWYEAGTTVSTGSTSAIRQLQPGEHYYLYDRTGEIPIERWQVKWGRVDCIHNTYPPITNPDFHGLPYTRNNCYQNHYSGWWAYCADCGQEIARANIYMSKEAAESIDYFEVGTGMDYYYLCPFCNNLEQGIYPEKHSCTAISWNQYKVRYDENTDGAAFNGYMSESFHMYNNATEYDGKPVTPITHLTLNTYTRIGYEFVEWNTEPDGSGQSFRDGQEILNLTDRNISEGGVVTLYAQWRRSSGTLKIDPNGGSYNGDSAVTYVTGDYGKCYQILNSTIKAPKGYTVSFHTNGGSEVAAITGTRHFTEWSMVNPFGGSIEDNVYYFIAPDGNVDTIVAGYELDSITLPDVTKPGSSFGGWYYNPECTDSAGGPGDKITPSKDMTLYAAWVDLKLFSENNYTDNSGKGAVDLSWTQSDNNNKTYKVYQSRNNATWNLITSATDIGTRTSISEDFGYTGTQKTYTVPVTGLYTLTASGAQGENYGSCKGGLGGSATVKLWLQKGEKITYTIGGQSGYNGGGTGTVYGGGGGSTQIVSDKQGILMIAGGGGGASANGNGGAGGSSVSLRADNLSEGVSGQTGGGAGYVGGNAGKYIVHNHTNACYIDVSRNIISEAGAGTIVSGTDGHENAFSDKYKLLTYGTKDSPIAVDGCTTLTFKGAIEWTDDNKCNNTVYSGRGLRVYNQSGQLIYDRTHAEIVEELTAMHDNSPWEYGSSTLLRGFSYYGIGNDDDGKESAFYMLMGNGETAKKYAYTVSKNKPDEWGYYNGMACESNFETYWKPEYIRTGTQWWGTYRTTYRDMIRIPDGTTGIYIEFDGQVGYCSYLRVEAQTVQLSGGKRIICGYTDGQVISSKPAYGGSNYINTSAAYEYSQKAGVRTGNGAFSIRSETVGYLDDLSLKGVVATDYAMPDPISAKSVRMEALSGTQVKVSWQEPGDNGTDYYHVAESYLLGSASPLCRSNVTKNTLISGIKGYYVLTNESAATEVTASNGSFISGRSRTVVVGEKVKYLHVAAVDKAGNIGGTVHIGIAAKDVEWKLYTEQLTIDEGDNVYPAVGDKTWYVRADGSTPFTLQHKSYLDGPATAEYQPNYIIYESVSEEISAKNIIYAPSVAVSDGEIRTDAEGLFYSVEGQSLIVQYPYSYTLRTDQNRRLQGVQSFTLEPVATGKMIDIIPGVGVEQDEGVFYSDYNADQGNRITIIGDGKAPVISGLEILEDKELINRNDGTIILNVIAEDEQSGIRDFYLEITNLDNAGSKTYTPGADGSIRIEITKDEPIFSGAFIVTAYASDNVGNERKLEYSITEFALQTEIERILTPHTPIFKCGESGILTITTWGYADRVEVEFPDEFTNLNPDLNRTYVYTDNPKFKQEEKLQFMVPLNIPVNQQYIITVRAYKGDKQLEDYPSFSTVAVEGSVLDELRTRLR